LARSALHLRPLAIYFGLAAVVEGVAAWSGHWTWMETFSALAVLAASAGAVFGLAWAFAALVSRTTLYTITSRRVVMRIGIALPMTLNVPFAIVAAAGLRLHRDDSGDLPLTLGGNGRVGFLHLWPHARPWRVARPEPMLRCVPEAQQVAAILSRALAGAQADRAEIARPDASADLTRPPVAA
jgi:hypothetical protein